MCWLMLSLLIANRLILFSPLDESLEASCRSLLQEHAVEVGLDMFGLLIARVNQLLAAHVAMNSTGADPGRGLSEDLRQLLPGLKTWVDWMMCHSVLWNPQPSHRPPDIGYVAFLFLSLRYPLFCELFFSLWQGWQ